MSGTNEEPIWKPPANNQPTQACHDLDEETIFNIMNGSNLYKKNESVNGFNNFVFDLSYLGNTNWMMNPEEIICVDEDFDIPLKLGANYYEFDMTKKKKRQRAHFTAPGGIYYKLNKSDRKHDPKENAQGLHSNFRVGSSNQNVRPSQLTWPSSRRIRAKSGQHLFFSSNTMRSLIIDQDRTQTEHNLDKRFKVYKFPIEYLEGLKVNEKCSHIYKTKFNISHVKKAIPYFNIVESPIDFSANEMVHALIEDSILSLIPYDQYPITKNEDKEVLLNLEEDKCILYQVAIEEELITQLAEILPAPQVGIRLESVLSVTLPTRDRYIIYFLAGMYVILYFLLDHLI